MSSSINTNISSLNAQRYVSNSAASLSTVMQRLSVGLRINSSADDAARLAIADRLKPEVSAAAEEFNKRIGPAYSVELSSYSDNLTSAKSSIRDTDFVSETANLTKNQVLMQAGTSMLPQANSRPQGIISLLRG